MPVMSVVVCKIYLCEFLCMMDNRNQGKHITLFQKQVQKFTAVLYNGQWIMEQLNVFLLDKMWYNLQNKCEALFVCFDVNCFCCHAALRLLKGGVSMTKQERATKDA